MSITEANEHQRKNGFPPILQQAHAGLKDYAPAKHGKLAPTARTVTKTIPSLMDKMNRTETNAFLYLQGSMTSTPQTQRCVMPFAVTLWLGPTTSYRPDFLVMEPPLKPEIFEVKGPYIYPRSLNKFKACVALFPAFCFRLMQWKDGAWTITKYS